MPLRISPTLTVLSLGRVIYDRPQYHTQRSIFPVGYRSQREHTSLLDPSQKGVYTSEIVVSVSADLLRCSNLSFLFGHLFSLVS